MSKTKEKKHALRPQFICRVVALLLAAALSMVLIIRAASAQEVSAPAPFPVGSTDVLCSSTQKCSDPNDSSTCVCEDNLSCEAPGTADEGAINLSERFRDKLRDVSIIFETWLYEAVSDIVEASYIQLQWLAIEMADWWDTMWYYGLQPSLQAMTRELNVDTTLQTLNLYTQADASALHELDLTLRRHALEDQGMRPGEQICVAGTMAGGYTRTTAFARAMRRAWEKESADTTLNTKDTPGQGSIAAANGLRYRNYLDNFCDPNSNTGKNLCNPAVKPQFYNSDIQVAKDFYNRLTISVDDPTDGEAYAKMVTSLIDNMVGVPAADPILKGSIESGRGRGVFIQRRSYIARSQALRSVPYMVASWRMPGSNMGQFVKDLRQNAGIDIGQISTNPSYKEIMHALSVDRFNSGTYAANMITDPVKIEMEKLSLSVFYLMQLRDYYQLLERTALTLAVQTSVLADQTSKMGGMNSTRPLKKAGP